MQQRDSKAIVTLSAEQEQYPPPASFRQRARVQSPEDYQRLYRESLDCPEVFWQREASELVFRTPWRQLLDHQPPFARWFVGARLNASESCLDRFLGTPTANKRALIWEAETGETSELTFAELHHRVVRVAAGLRKLGVSKGDRVVIYMGMVPEAVVAMLACARIGAPHSVVFGGFASDALRTRIEDCGAKVIITQDASLRRGHLIPLKEAVDHAVEHESGVEKVVVFRRTHTEIHWDDARDVEWRQLEDEADPGQGEPEIVDANHPLFILYTSGSTGKPKGILHSTAGYLVGTHVSSKYVFDLQDDDIYWCTADVGWVTGHSYLTYGPLSNGATCLMYEGAPNFPDWGRFWQLIERHRVTILYTAPTAIRAFIKAGDEWVDRHDLSSLRLLGSVGEPINPEAWLWYYNKVGGQRCPVVDTWWQTETGSIMLTTLPGACYSKPGATGLPFFGVEPAVVASDGTPVQGRDGGLLIVRRPWPAMMLTVWGDDERFKQQYFSEVPGNVYFTGDGAHRDPDGHYRVVGRIDDVLMISGHRIGTAEVESSMVAHQAVAEAAAVGRPDEIKGQGLVVFVTLKPGFEASEQTRRTLVSHVAEDIGHFARPDEVRFAEGLPKTRSGKIMRRLLKDIAAGRQIDGDTSTLEDASTIHQLRQQD